jgi:hypothetical protein
VLRDARWCGVVERHRWRSPRRRCSASLCCLCSGRATRVDALSVFGRVACAVRHPAAVWRKCASLILRTTFTFNQTDDLRGP